MKSFLALCSAALLVCSAQPALAQQTASVTGARVDCTGGKASIFSCKSVDLLAYLAIDDLFPFGASPSRKIINDLWGWTDPESGKEYVVVGRYDAAVFVDVSDPVNPLVLGVLPSHNGGESWWRDVKVYRDHAFIVADNVGAHGMQVFDLTNLRSVNNPPVEFSESAWYGEIGSAHNVVINEETGFAYAVGSSGSDCSEGLHMIDIRDPLTPTFAGCFRDTSTGRGNSGYTHDAQCVIYRGPDELYQGREICIGANETAVSVADVTDKSAPVALAARSYPAAGYTHQGWLTEDHAYYVMNDEFDEFELSSRLSPRTLIWDMRVLDDPIMILEFYGGAGSTDHNLYIRGNYVFEANYTSGLRIIDITDIFDPREIAYFDTYPANNETGFEGAWSGYPFFASGTIVVTSQTEGLFMLEAAGLELASDSETAHELPDGFRLLPAHPNPFNPATALSLELPSAQNVRVAAYDLTGREIRLLHDGPLEAGVHVLRFEAGNLPSGRYAVRATGESNISTQLVTLAR